MQPSGSIIVHGKDGWHGTVVPASPSAQADASQMLVQLDTGQQLLVSAEALVQQQDGSYYLPLTLEELEPHRWGLRSEAGKTTVIPVIEEELDVQKRVVETGKVRVTKVVHERESVVDEPLFRDEVEVERVLIDRVVDGPVSVRYEEDTMIVPIMEEVLVIEKRLILKEKLHIRKRRVETHQPQQVTLRREEVRIERLESTDKG
jgi:uncharacterized protein (TIGR02271 family)